MSVSQHKVANVICAYLRHFHLFSERKLVPASKYVTRKYLGISTFATLTNNIAISEMLNIIPDLYVPYQC